MPPNIFCLSKRNQQNKKQASSDTGGIVIATNIKAATTGNLGLNNMTIDPLKVIKPDLDKGHCDSTIESPPIK